MIPKSIGRVELLRALAVIDEKGIPNGRQARRNTLVHDGKRYPPKYAVALAHQLMTGGLLDSESFGGGKETNSSYRAGAETFDAVRIQQVFGEAKEADPTPSVVEARRF